MKVNTRTNIIISVIGILIGAGLLAYYLTREELWKKEAHIGFAALFLLLGWRLWRTLKEHKKE